MQERNLHTLNGGDRGGPGGGGIGGNSIGNAPNANTSVLKGTSSEFPPPFDPRTETYELRPGTVVAGKFRIERVLSEGGMGLVVAATHLDLDQLVALKFFRADVGSDRRTLLERFTREARAAARLKSEHVARVLDVAVTDDGRPYMVIEYLEGQSLDRLLKDGGPLPVAHVAEYAIQACEGLAEAHSRGIVHRDVSPSNLFLVKRTPGVGSIKILDFGISKVARSDLSASNVATNIMMGTPCYMSPEQIRSTATVDHRADIWSLGATMYHLLAAKTPFDASQDLLALAESIVFDPPPPLRLLRPEVPEGLAAVVARCLCKDRDGRYPSAGELAMALLPFAGPQARTTAERALSLSPAAPTPLLVSDGAAQGTRVTTQAAEAVTGIPPVPFLRRPSVPRGVLIATGVAFVVSVFSWTASLLLSKRPAPPAVAVQPAPPQPAPAVSPPPPLVIGPPSDLKQLSVRVSPPSARIWIDGIPVGDNPFRGAYPRNGVHSIEASAKGYRTKRETITLAEDVPVDLTLDRDRQSPSGGDSTRAASRSDRSERARGQGKQDGKQDGKQEGKQDGKQDGRNDTRSAERGDRSERGEVRADRGRVERLMTTDLANSAPSSARASARTARTQERLQEVDPAGGREPMRPIEVRNPYDN